jgi:cation-transporting ATPase E
MLAAIVASDDRPNPTMAAIGSAAGAAPDLLATAVEPFSSARKFSGATFGGVAYRLGAFDVLLPPDSHMYADGSDLAAGGARVLALTGDGSPLALVVLDQRIRASAPGTLRYFGEQGVDVKVISGDSPLAVGAIARALGITGAVVDARTPGFDVASTSVFGRVTPQQKREMIGALKADGRTVAMTGDGVNDALALKDADLGIAMGSGSGATRAVAKVVLLNDDFATLPYVLGEGRRVLANIERVANLFLTKTVYSVLLALLIGIVGLPFPFLPRQVTLVASLTIGIPGFFLALAPSNERARPHFVRRVLRFAIPAGVVCAAATFLAYALARANSASDLTEDRSTATVTLFVVATFALGLVAAPLDRAKRALLIAVVAAFALVCAWPWARHLAQLEFANLRNNLVALAIAALACLGLVALLRWDHWSGRPRSERG